MSARCKLNKCNLSEKIMKCRNYVLAVALLLSAASSFSQSLGYDGPEIAFKSQLTRAEVVEQMRIAQVNGETKIGELYGLEMSQFKSMLARSTVVSDLIAAQANNPVTYGELSFEQPVYIADHRTREEVRDEAVIFAHSHTNWGVPVIYIGN